jgi:membrane protein insertase Oxa1/YidC/SpoIIIJ
MGKPTPKAICLPTELDIPVQFSIFTAEYSTSQLATIKALQKQIDKINEAYDNLDISFEMASVHYHIGEQF